MEALLWLIIIGWIIVMIVTYWPIAIGIIVIIVIVNIISKQKQNEENEYRYDFDKDLNSMDGIEFERYVAELLKNNGYSNVKVTQASGDHGIDILADKDELRYGIQCKRYSSSVGNFAIHEAYSGAAFYDCDVAMVVTNNKFTKSAVVEAKKLGVILWDGTKLYSLKQRTSKKNKRERNKFSEHEAENTGFNYNDKVIIECPNCNVGIRVKKTNGKMLAIKCTRCNYTFFERT